MKRFMLTVILTCVLSVTAIAGEMPTVGAVAASSEDATQESTLEASSDDGTQESLIDTVILTIISMIGR